MDERRYHGPAASNELRAELSPRERYQLRPHVVTGGRVRAELEELQARFVQRLTEVDTELSALATERIDLTRLLREIRDAIGTGDRYCRPAPLPEEVDAAPEGTREVRGTALRAALRRVLVDHAGPLRADELARGLRVRGLRPPAPPGKAISDALRAELARGRVERTGRGEYRWAG